MRQPIRLGWPSASSTAPGERVAHDRQRAPRARDIEAVGEVAGVDRRVADVRAVERAQHAQSRGIDTEVVRRLLRTCLDRRREPRRRVPVTP